MVLESLEIDVVCQCLRSPQTWGEPCDLGGQRTDTGNVEASAAVGD